VPGRALPARSPSQAVPWRPRHPPESPLSWTAWQAATLACIPHNRLWAGSVAVTFWPRSARPPSARGAPGHGM